MITIPNWTEATSRFEASPTGRMLADPAMQPFRDNLKKKLGEKYLGTLEKDLGLSPEKFIDLIQGQLTVAVIQGDWNGEDDTEPGWVVILDAGDKESALREQLTEVRKKLTTADRGVRTERVRDVEFTRVEIEEAGDEGGNDGEIFFGQSGATLLVGNSTQPLEKVLARIAGASIPPLTDDPAFKSSEESFRDSHGYGWLNTGVLVPLIGQAVDRTADNVGDGLPFEIKTAIRAIGLEGLKAATFGLKDTAEGQYVELSLGVPEAQRTGLFKILHADPKDAAPPAFVPGDTIEFQRWRVDGVKAWAELEETIKKVSPEAFGFFQMFTSMAGKDKDPSFDFKQMFVANLGDDVISYSKLAASPTTPSPSIFLVQARNSDQLLAGFQALIGLLPFGADQSGGREFLGRQIRSIELPTGANGSSQTVEYTTHSGYLAVSSSPAMLEEFLRSSEGVNRPLQENPALREAAERIGGFATGLFGYQNQRAALRPQWELLRTGAMDSLPGGIGGNVAEVVDFKLLPEYDKIARYIGINIHNGVIDSRGLHLRVFAPTPMD